MIKKAAIASVWICLLGAYPAFSQIELPVDDRDVWRIGIAEFSSIGLSPENNYVSSSFPLMIFETLSRCDSHTYAPEESKDYRKVIVQTRIDELQKELDLAVSARDKSFVSGASEEKLADKDLSVERIRESMATLGSADLGSIIVKQNKPIELLDSGEQFLLPPIVGDAASYSLAHDLDLLVFGLIEEIETYLFADVSVFSLATGGITTFQGAFSREKLTESSQPILDELVETALGREWARLLVTCSEETADIYIDGIFRGIGDVSIDLINTGEHTIWADAHGFSPYEVVIDIAAGTEITEEIVLERDRGEMVSLDTIPSYAELYALSQWYGTTPASIPSTMRNIQGIIKKDGYSDFLMPVIPDSDDEVVISLVPEALDRRALMDSERADFYSVFAAFIFSLPIPIVLFDTTNTLTSALNSETTIPTSIRNLDELPRLFNLRQAALSGYVGGLFISAALFVDAVVKLLKYIDLADLSVY
ncbi:MAG: PEGA domain-containing protein [Spirochaetales bacterium]|jgi:hypothetical protein|nr:PEGA domain-containing protein [Spirochaetales bacterium]